MIASAALLSRQRSAKALLMPGPAPRLGMRFAIANLGYTAEEYLISGTARSFAADPRDGPSAGARPSGAADYRTRLVVFQPADPEGFSGTCVIEWLNCHVGVDAPAQWMRLHRHMARAGMIWVGISAQRGGIHGTEGSGLERLHPKPDS